MRVGLFTYGVDGTRSTGIAQYAMELTRALKALHKGPEIILLTPYKDSATSWYHDFETYPVPSLRLMPAAATFGNMVLHRAATDLALDILHDPCGIAPFLAAPRRYRTVVTVHDAVPYLYPRTQPLLTNLVFQTLIRAARFSADAVLTVSRQSASDLVRYAGLPNRKVHPVPLASRFAAAAEPHSGDEHPTALLRGLGVTGPYFLFVGTLHPRKNLERTLEAFVNVRRRRPDTSFVIVGPPYWGASNTLRTVLSRAGDGSGVVFTNFVSDSDLQTLYANATALVFASLYEGFGLPALEAMALGAPVIASNSGSLPEVVGSAAVLVDPRSIDSISDAMLRLLDDDRLAADYRRRGLDRAGEFSWRRTAERTLSVYEQVLNTNRGR